MGSSVKILFANADYGGCGHYRMIYPGQAAARAQALRVEFDQNLPIHRTIHARPEVVGVGDIDADVLVLQRPLKRVVAQSIPFWQKKGIPVVVDVDDDFSCLNAQNKAWALYHPKYSPEENWNWMKQAAAAADLVTCSTPALAQRYGGRGNAIVLENCVPEEYLSFARRGDGRTVGWSGFESFHAGDLEVTRGGVAQAVATGECHFLNVGNGIGVARALGLPFEDEEGTSAHTGGRQFQDFQYTLGQLDVGIVPLADTKFNQGKSYLKGLEYAAAGVPFVASPVPSYTRLWNEGLGMLAPDRGKDWKRAILSFFRDKNHRDYVAEAGRDLVKEKFTYEKNYWRWCEAYEAVLESRIRQNLEVV